MRMQKLPHGVSDIVWDRPGPVRPGEQRNLSRELRRREGLRRKLAMKSLCPAIAERRRDRPPDAPGDHRHQRKVTANFKLRRQIDIVARKLVADLPCD